MGTTPKPEQVGIRGASVRTSHVACLTFFYKGIVNYLRMSECGRYVRCNVGKLRTMVANTATVYKILNKLANEAFVRVKSQLLLEFEWS